MSRKADVEAVRALVHAAGLDPDDENTVNNLFDALCVTTAERYGLTNQQMNQWCEVVMHASAIFIKKCQIENIIKG